MREISDYYTTGDQVTITGDDETGTIIHVTTDGVVISYDGYEIGPVPFSEVRRAAGEARSLEAALALALEGPYTDRELGITA